jgi:glycerate kinase
MNILILSDSFKGSLPSAAAGECLRSGFARVFPNAVYRVLSMADGGEGTVEALVAGVGGRYVTANVSDPLGRPITAQFALLDDGTAVIEMAAASGLALLDAGERDPSITSTRGTGELIRVALDNGATRLFIGIGGSATNDGGTGMARALGARFLDAQGRELPEGGLALRDLASIDTTHLDARLAQTPVAVACDVTNPLCGANGASFVYGPQKGADPELCAALDAALSRYGALLGGDIANQSGAGAAGGLGAGLIAFCGGELKPGIDEITRLLQLDRHVRWADLVLTGEGQIDRTSAMGKVLSGVGALGKRYGKPVLAFGGGIGVGAEAVYDAGVSAYTAITSRPMTLGDAIADASELLTAAAERAARFVATGIILQ